MTDKFPMVGRNNSKIKRSWLSLINISIAASLFLHLAVFLALWIADHSLFNEPEPEAIEVSFIETPKPIQPAKPLDPTAQIVDQSTKSMNDETPDDAKFLSQHNQRVVKETRAANIGKFKNKVGGGEARQAEKKNKAKNKEKSKTAAKPLTGSVPTLADLTPKFNWEKVKSDGHQGLNQGHAQTNDYLKDMDEGIQTVLNTREFVYYSYYSRIKNKLQQYWEPKIKEKMNRLLRQGRTIASTTNDKVTQVIIVLNSNGILQKVQVIGESGVSDLDDAAVEAFRAAAPFPNPPAGIIENDGTVKIRWDFVLEA